MKSKISKERLAIILGGLTLFLFSTKPYILDFIEPSKSIGQLIGENAKELLESLNGENQNSNTPNSKRETWSNIIIILSFALFVLSIIFSIDTIRSSSKKWYGIVGGMLSIIGLGIYFFHLALGLIGLVIIAFLAVAIVFIKETI